MGKKQFGVVALGELLVDLTESGQSRQDNPLFEANPGGAPANVLAMLREGSAGAVPSSGKSELTASAACSAAHFETPASTHGRC